VSGDDWQAGDLALCVKGGCHPDEKHLPPVDFPIAGKIYTVEWAGKCRFVSGFGLALGLVDGPPNVTKDRVWNASRFRKIRPHAPDEEDRETIELLTGVKVPALIGEA